MQVDKNEKALQRNAERPLYIFLIPKGISFRKMKSHLDCRVVFYQIKGISVSEIILI